MELLTKALDNADVLVTTGGVSMGEKVQNCYYANADKNLFQSLHFSGLVETSSGD